MTTNPEKIPLPYWYFGSKARTAALTWFALGDVRHYIDPFFGGGSAFLRCPAESRERLRTVIINDIDCYIANFWRAVKHAPAKVAGRLDWPLNEAEIEARHKRLVMTGTKDEFARRVRDEAEYFDATLAGDWAYGLNAWIGGGFCGGEFVPEAKQTATRKTRGAGLVGPKLPAMLTPTGPLNGRIKPGPYIASLAELLRPARVLCGDWARAAKLRPEGKGGERGATGILLDPPYAAEAKRAAGIYRVDDMAVAHDVRRFALERGRDPNVRIILCGYDIEHPSEELAGAGWTEIAWSSINGYASGVHGECSPDARGKANRHRERLWLSPGCVVPTAEQLAELCKSARVIEHAPARRSQAKSHQSVTHRPSGPAAKRGRK